MEEIRIENTPSKCKKIENRNWGFSNWLKCQIFKIPRWIQKLFSLRILVLLGVLLLLNEQDVFNKYEAIQEAIDLIASIINWAWNLVVNILEQLKFF